MGQILEAHAKFFELKTNPITIDKEILRELCLDNHDFEKIITEQSERKFAEWQIVKDEMSFDGFMERFKTWHDMNNFGYVVESKGELVTLKVSHQIGARWSKFQCMLNIRLLKKIKNCEVVSKKIDNLIYSIDIKTLPKYPNV